MNDVVNDLLISSSRASDFKRKSHRCFSIDWAVEAGEWSELEPIDQVISQIVTCLEQSNLDWPAYSCEASVVFSNDEAVRTLNRDFRNINKTTNVLSFPSSSRMPSLGDIRHIGDVILASETILRESVDLDLPPRHHLIHLIIHGILHLLGYDHESAADADTMETLETRLLTGLGIPDPYQA